MSSKKPIFIALCAIFAMTLSAHAQTSVYRSMAAVGNFNGTNTSPNLMLVSNYTWQGEFYFYEFSNRFIFVASNNLACFFGETNQPPNFSHPVTGTAERAIGGDIIVTNTPAGLYRITFNDSTLEYRVELLYTIAYGVNILQNPSFETQGSSLYETYEAPPWTRSSDGNPNRNSERSHSGSWAGAVDQRGYWYQETAANIISPGFTYQGSAWFWTETNVIWTSSDIQLKIEFFDGGRNPILPSVYTNFVTEGGQWIKKTLRVVAPTGIVYARMVVVCGNSAPGTLRFDDAELRSIATQNQDFDQFGYIMDFTNDGANAWDDWMIGTGKVTPISAYLNYSASLPYSAGSTNFVRSARLPEGLGSISFWYRHAATSAVPTESVSFIVQKSYDNNTWIPLDAVTNILTTTYLQYQSYQNDPTSCYIRIVHNGGSTNRLLIDDVDIALPTAARRYQDFNDWPGSTDYGRYERGDWLICTGRINSADSSDGKAAEIFYLHGNNFLRSPQFSNGIISFKYRCGTNGRARELHASDLEKLILIGVFYASKNCSKRMRCL